jgi:uncharacterized protein
MAKKRKLKMTIKEHTEAANRGDTDSRDAILRAYVEENTVECWEDNEGWIIEEALDGFDTAQYVLYSVVYSGDGGKSSDEARERIDGIMADALENGNLEAAMFKAVGCMQEHDYHGVAEWCMKSVKYGIPDADDLLEFMYLKTTEYAMPAEVDEDSEEFESCCREKALDVVEAFAETGYANAQFDLAYHYAYRVPEAMYGAAFKWFEKAAEQEHAEAEYNLGVLCLNGCGTEKSPERAREWFSKAAEHGYEQAKPFLQ